MIGKNKRRIKGKGIAKSNDECHLFLLYWKVYIVLTAGLMLALIDMNFDIHLISMIDKEQQPSETYFDCICNILISSRILFSTFRSLL